MRSPLSPSSEQGPLRIMTGHAFFICPIPLPGAVADLIRCYAWSLGWGQGVGRPTWMCFLLLMLSVGPPVMPVGQRRTQFSEMGSLWNRGQDVSVFSGPQVSGSYHREHTFRTELAPTSELGISFCPQPTSLLAAKPARSLWNLATHRKQWKLGVCTLLPLSLLKGFSSKPHTNHTPTLTHTHTYTHQLFFFLHPLAWGCLEIFSQKRHPG